MGKVDREGRRSSGGDRKPPLTPEVLDGADFAVLTVADARVNIPVGDRYADLLEFAEHPEYVLWLNKTGLDELCERLGDDTDDWIDERVPIEKVRTTNPQTGRTVVKYWIATGEGWDEVLAEFDKRRKPRAPAKPKAAAKKKNGRRKKRKK